jgi:predicted ArsR family transcriptional regulator
MMMKDLKITFNELDFILPSYRYNIRFSFSTKQGLSFIREFILRLVQLGPMSPGQIAKYMGLNEREAKEALSDLLSREELQYNDHGYVELTEKSSGYFDSLGGSLNVCELRTSGTNLGFELTSLSCVSTQKNRLPKEWKFGCRLDVQSEKIAKRDKLISKAFQRHFQSLIEDGYMDHLKNEQGGKPNIYKVESLTPIGQEPLRLKLKFMLDIEGHAVESEDFEFLKDSTEAHELITEYLHQARHGDNHHEILDAIEMLGDTHTSNLFSSTGFNVDSFIDLKASAESDCGRHIPFIGSLYSKENWAIFSNFLEKEKKNIISKHQDGIADFIWLAPTDPTWGKSEQVISCFTEIIQGSMTTGKKAKRLYAPKIFLPQSGSSDDREKKRWVFEFEKVKNSLFGYVEGYHQGAVEVVLLESRLVAVTYYLHQPEYYRVALPVGFISTDETVVNRVASSLNKYLSEYHTEDHTNDLGKLT